ncbi:MAG: GAF domain-containing protein [Chloroflexi bacterium]|nr:GAF domain-containing protein [Chloroflexota bacterium]
MKTGLTNPTAELEPGGLWQRLFEPHLSVTDIGQRRQARLIAVIALILAGTHIIGALAAYMTEGDIRSTLILIALAASCVVGYSLARRPRYRNGGYLIVWLLTVSGFANFSGAASLSYSLYVYMVIAFVFAGLSFPFRYMVFYVVFCNAAIGFLHLIHPGYANAGFDLAVFIPLGTLVLTSMKYRDNVERDRVKEVLKINQNLEEAKSALEQRVEERTRQLENQSLRLRVVAEIARDAATARDVSDLLERGAQLIQERFGFYQTGIFLLDNNHEYAVLTASSTEAGRQMIANGYKIGVGETNLVGRAAATGEPQVSLESRPDAADATNPFLPNARSEMALPLKVENRTVGILNVQSGQSQVFTDEDMNIMRILADQLAIAIERTRLFQQAEDRLKELQQAYGRVTREAWKSLAESGLLKNAGYRFDNVRIQPINTAPELGEEVMQTGKMTLRTGDGRERSNQTQAAIPIKLRGQPIGVVTVKLKEGYRAQTIAALEQAVERLAASLESARLFEEARLRADREQAISHVTSAISAAGEFDAILRTTVEEIGKSLGDSEVSIQISGEL